MPGLALSALFAIAIAKATFAQPDPADPTPLTDKHYSYPTGIVSTASNATLNCFDPSS